MSRCGTCNVSLNSGEELRSHYGSEFHLTNVRRRVDGQRALTMQEFRHSGLANTDGDVDDGADGAPVFSCTLCKKTFRSVQTLQTHIRSTAHLMRKEQRIIARDGEGATLLTTSTMGSAAMGLHRRHKNKQGNAGAREKPSAPRPRVSLEEREEDASETRCMLCGFASATFEENLLHMQRVHEFFIPMEDRVTDMPGLLAYLARKVNGLMCLVCNENTKAVSSLAALRDHMKECGHDRMVLNPEYDAFYNCELEDPENIRKAQLDGVQGDQLVLVSDAGRDGGRKVLLKREADVPRPRGVESSEEIERRRMITAADHQALVAARKEQREIMQRANNENAKIVRGQGNELQSENLKVGMLSNKLHGKGYDGNMMFS